MAKLNPPHIESKLPAFYDKTIKIPFQLNRAVGKNEFSEMQILIKTVQTNIEKYSGKTSQIDKDNGIVTFELEFTPISGQYYKIQIAFIDGSSTIGYYSNVGIVKCTSQPTLSIEGLNKNINNSNKYTYTGVYKNPDSNEKVYNYYFNIYNEQDELYETSGILLHNHSNQGESITTSTDSWSPIKNLLPGKNYTVEYGVKTLNLLEELSVRYKISDSFLIAPPTWFDGELHATLYPDDGYVELTLHGNNLYGNFILNRASSKDNFETWNKITEFKMAKTLNGTLLWQDFTVEHGIEYLYSIQMCNENNIKTVHMYNKEYKILVEFEDMFLFDGKQQLKIRFNPKVSSFKTTKLESKIDTIGSQFPFFFHNGNVEYKEFPISGLISMLTDENQLFITANNNYSEERNGTPSKIQIAQGTGSVQLTTENIQLEREFKLNVLNWLNNGEFKLFRSPGEGNYIVRLLNVSLSPNDTLGRMLHTFSCTAYEVMEYNFENLKNQNYLKVDNLIDFQIQHITSSLDVFNKPFGGLIINDNEIIAQDNLLMYNIVITNMVSTAYVSGYDGTSTKRYQANIAGLCTINTPCFKLKFNEDISLKLATLDFDFINYLDDYIPWQEFNKIKSVAVTAEIKYLNLYSKTDWTSKYVNKDDNTFNYLAYLNDVKGQVGEVYYLYIRKRELKPSEVLTASYILNIENYDNNLNPKIAGSGRVYQQLGTLSKLECGNGFDIDIVYLQKTLS